MGDHEHAVGRFAHRSHHLVVVGVPHQDDRVALARVADGLQVHLGHEGARGVDHPQAPPLRLVAHRRRDAVGAEDHGGVVRHLVQLVHEVGALGAQRLHDVPVVDDLLAHVHRRRADLQGQLDDVDGAVHARAEAAGAGKDDVLEQRYGRHAFSWVEVRTDASIPEGRGRAQIVGSMETFRAWPPAMRASACGTSARPIA